MLLNEWKNHNTSITLQLHKLREQYTVFVLQPSSLPRPKYYKTYNGASKYARKLAQNMNLEEECL